MNYQTNRRKNTEASGWFEGGKSWVVGFFDKVDFIVTDPLGRKVGFFNGTRYNEIPLAFQTLNSRIEYLIIWNTIPGAYKLEVSGVVGDNGVTVLSSSSSDDIVEVETSGISSVIRRSISSRVVQGSKGDVNKDGAIDAQDLEELQALVPVFTDGFDHPGDINSDGVLDEIDVALLTEVLHLNDPMTSTTTTATSTTITATSTTTTTTSTTTTTEATIATSTSAKPSPKSSKALSPRSSNSSPPKKKKRRGPRQRKFKKRGSIIKRRGLLVNYNLYMREVPVSCLKNA